MRVLLDHNVDWRIARALPQDWEIATTRSQGWADYENGDLLAAAQVQFDLFLTTDKALYGQQNVPNFEIAVIVLRVYSNRLDQLLPFAAEVIATAERLNPHQIEWIYADENLRDSDKRHSRGAYVRKDRDEK